MCTTLLQGSFDKIKIAKNQLTRFSVEGRQSVNWPVDLGFPNACSMIVWIPCHDTISIGGISIMQPVSLPRSGLESTIDIPVNIGALSSTMGCRRASRELADDTLCKSWIWPHSMWKACPLHQRAVKCLTLKFSLRLRGPPHVIQLRCDEM